MKAYDILISITLMFCLMSLVWAAPDNTTSDNTTSDDTTGSNDSSVLNKVQHWGSDGGNHVSTPAKSGQTTKKATSINKVTGNAETVSGDVMFASTSNTGIFLDNTKKVAVYMPEMLRTVFSESAYIETGEGDVDIPVTFDPLTTSMFFEYNPDYLNDSNIGSRLTKANYALLIVPISEMSTTAENNIISYIASGGSVWFLNDPCDINTGNALLTTVIGNGVSASIGRTTRISIVNTDSITSGLPASFTPAGQTSKTAKVRSLSGSGTIGGLSYQVLMNTSTNALLVKYENQATGARVIYSNPNMFISGGTSSYFDAANATKLFTQTKSWVMNLAQNPSVLMITYPESDKQLTVTCDDMDCTDWSLPITPMIDAETSAGLTPDEINTFFIIPGPDGTRNNLEYYESVGDTHTLHPHYLYLNNTWIPDYTYGPYFDKTDINVATFTNDITFGKQTINEIMGTDYGFTSFRFPMTTFCTNSMQAVSNNGFTIESSTGDNDGYPIGNQADNNLFFPKQALVNNAKTTFVELEMPASFDINYNTGTEYYNAYNAYTGQFKYVNFPANFVIGGHYQGIGVNGLPDWGVTSTNLTEGFGQILNAEKAANPNYATFDTLAKYINGIKNATITATYDGTSTTVTVTNTKPITGFTIKAGNGNVKSATCSNAAVTTKTDSLTGATYIIADLATGSHTFLITSNITPVLPVANFTSNVTQGYVPLTVQFNDTSKNATAWSWDFGDGANSTQRNTTHVYTATGNFTVNLTASNGNGTSLKSATINVSATPILPVAKFTSNVTQGSAPLAVLFNDTSTNAAVWKWDFGDGTNSTERNTTHVYTAVGNFTVNLTASNANGSNSSLAPINVTGITVFPNCTNPPTDLNNDKLYEDINGNRQLDFDDVVSYFDNIGWIAQKGLITNFDFDNSGSIDYNDVVKLCGMI